MPRNAGRLDGLRRIGGHGLKTTGAGLKAGVALARRYPLASLGTAAFGAFFVWVSSNALFAQSERHAAPLVTTRGMPEPSLDIATGSLSDPLVKELQTALAQTGYYRKRVDGRYGPGTRAAIEMFQDENGLAVTGRASPELLKEVRQVAMFAAPSPSPKPVEWTDVEEREITETADGRSARVISTGDQVSSIIELEQLDASTQSERVRQIQAALTAINVATLEADGIPGTRTKAAIREFQGLEGLEVTGEPDVEVLEQLVRIGAL